MVQRFGRTPSLICCWKDTEHINNEEEAKKEPRATISELGPYPISAAMNSPLPDSSALEAGILEDERPSRLSRVQDNVRNLLRSSVFGAPSIKSSPTTPTHRRSARDFPNEASPLPQHGHIEQPEVLPSPSSTNSSFPTHYTSSPLDTTAFPRPQDNMGPFTPPIPGPQAETTYHQNVHQTDHQSTLFNTRAVAALNHPDLSDPSLATFSQQKMQKRCRSRGGWTRTSSSRKGRKKAATAVAGSRAVLCLLAALLLAALVATYITIATTTSGLTTTFHVLFVLGICLATIVFAYTVIQLFVVGKGSKKQHQPLFIAVSRHGGYERRHRHHHQHNHSQRHPQERAMPTLTGENDFIPTMPIAVHLSSDDLIRTDPIPAQPTAGAEMASQTWDKDAQELPNPPPAYGRWRSSVRANPDLLHWQSVPSPVTPALPSPTYEEAVAEGRNESPPSYVTRESPARRREMREARAGIARSVVVEPEMVEARGVGVGLAM